MGSPLVNGLSDSVQKLWPFQAVKSFQNMGDKVHDAVAPLLAKMGLSSLATPVVPESSYKSNWTPQPNQEQQEQIRRQYATPLHTMTKPLKDR